MYKTIVVVDHDDLLLSDATLPVITFGQYLADYPKLNEPKLRIINLCDTEHYLSRGYYCSLLAEARQHKVLPSVGTINDLRDLTLNSADDLALSMFGRLPQLDTEEMPVERFVFFGWVQDKGLQKLVRQVFEKYPAPILRVRIERDANGVQLCVSRCAFAQLATPDREQFLQQLQAFTRAIWRHPASQRRLRWDMAILVNPDEKYPPSDKEAIRRFIKAAAKVGILAETITAHDAAEIPQYDALFIRETTAIDHHTYRLARKAEQEGLVVIDDSTSILRCCNKVFLHDAFTYNSVPSLRTRVVASDSDADIDAIESHFAYPMVVKMPEGSFSRGVFKVQSREELKRKIAGLLAETALVLVQEYVYTEFDWRVGVLNGRALYACRYHMARNHWQIYNHNARRCATGSFETLPTFEVPRTVLDAALKAAAMVGTGLYGVDLKQVDRHVYVMEVNDNPNIDHNVEDYYLGNELYMQIMSEFSQRLEKRGR